MFKTFDWNAIIAGIALIAAISSPVITAIANNIYQLKLKDREIMTNRKLNIIEQYLKAISETYHRPGIQNDFAQYSVAILLYAPTELQEKIIRLNELLAGKKESSETVRLMHEIAVVLRGENKIN